MVERYKRGKGKKKLLGSHAKSWIWGRNLVVETLAAEHWPIADLYLADTLPEETLNSAQRRAEALGIPVSIVDSASLEKLGHTGEHQGFLARMEAFPYVPFEELLRDNAGQASFYAILDGIQDPYNLGAILRSAEVFGVRGAIIQATGQTGVTSMVARSSAGAVNRIPIARVDSLEDAADRLLTKGSALVGASEKATKTLPDCDFKRPIAIVIGNEGNGIRPSLLSRCTDLVRIPQHGHVGSLNAAVAAGIFFYEARRQQSK